MDENCFACAALSDPTPALNDYNSVLSCCERRYWAAWLSVSVYDVKPGAGGGRSFANQEVCPVSGLHRTGGSQIWPHLINISARPVRQPTTV